MPSLARWQSPHSSSAHQSSGVVLAEALAGCVTDSPLKVLPGETGLSLVALALVPELE